MTDRTALREFTNPFRAAEERGRRLGHREAADHLERVAAEWTGTEGGQNVAKALRLEARNVRRIQFEQCSPGVRDR